MAPLLVSSPGILAGPEIGNPIPIPALAAILRPSANRLSPSRLPSWPPPGMFPLWRRPQARGSPPPAA